MGWQDFVAIAVVLGAGAYLVGLVYHGVAGDEKAGCGTACGKCSHDGAPEQLVAIGPAPVNAAGRPGDSL